MIKLNSRHVCYEKSHIECPEFDLVIQWRGASVHLTISLFLVVIVVVFVLYLVFFYSLSV